MKIHFIFIFGVVCIFLLNNVLASEYCLMRLKDSESIPSNVYSISKNLICKNGRCTCHLDSGGGYCQVCTDLDGYYAQYNYCGSTFCQEDPNSTQNLILESYFPFSGEYFFKQRVELEIKTNKLAKIEIFDNLNDKSSVLCNKCSYIKRYVMFNQGENDIIIKATTSNESKEEKRNFFIDSQSPRIIKIMPSQNKFATGEFNITYDENNLKSIFIYYGDDNGLKKKKLENCESGKQKTCSINLDIKEFDSKKIEYYFTVTDIADNEIMSKITKINVDTTKPVIKTINYTIDKNKLGLEIEVDEANPYRIIYQNNDDKEKILCNSLKDGKCKRTINFEEGLHILTIEAIDKAGNTDSKDIEVEI